MLVSKKKKYCVHNNEKVGDNGLKRKSFIEVIGCEDDGQSVQEESS